MLVCAVDFTLFSRLSLSVRSFLRHTWALPCLVVGYLTAVHWFMGHLDGDREDLARRMLANAVSAASGTALVALAAILAAAAEMLGWSRRKPHAVYYFAGSAMVALLSMLLLLPRWTAMPGHVAIVCILYAAACLIVNLRWREPLVGRLGIELLILASAWGMYWGWADQLQLWAFALAVEALVLSLVGALRDVGRRRRSAIGMLGTPVTSWRLTVGSPRSWLQGCPWDSPMRVGIRTSHYATPRRHCCSLVSFANRGSPGPARCAGRRQLMLRMRWSCRSCRGELALLALLTHASLVLASGLLVSRFRTASTEVGRIYKSRCCNPR